MGAINLITVLVAIALVIYLYLKRLYTYWARRGLEYIEPEFIYGNAKRMIKGEISYALQFQEIYNELKARGLKHGGYYILFTPGYMPIDPELIKCILQKDFSHFMNHGTYVNEEADPLSGHLFNLEDAKWRNLRAKLTPTFTSGKMKMMFHTLVACSEALIDLLNDHSIIQDVVDIKDVLSRFTTDVIGSCAFGLECNSLKNPNAEFRTFGKKIFDESFIGKMKRIAELLIPKNILIKIGFKMTRTDVESFFINIVKNTVEYREKNKIFRKDFMQLLLQLKNSGKVTEDDTVTEAEGKQTDGTFLTMNELTAQCVVFFLAGFETSAATMTFALYELAVNQDIQDKLREEILMALEKNDNKMTYDSVMGMSYMEKVISETLRKHSPAGAIPRVCNKAYTVPGTNVELEKGTILHIPVYAIHHDPEYYPNPEVFDPERFSEENKAKRPPFTYLPFGEGPRICIGLRFGNMETKVGLATILRNFRVTMNEKTKTPISLDKRAFVLGIEGDLWLNVSRIN